MQNKLCVWHEYGIIPCLYIWQCHTFPRWWFSPFLLSFAWCCSLLNALTCQSQPECNNVYIMYLTFNMALNLTWLGSINCLLASLCETWTCNTSCHTTTNTVPTLDRIQCIPTYPDITCPGLLTVPVLIAQLHPLHGIHALDKPNVFLKFAYIQCHCVLTSMHFIFGRTVTLNWMKASKTRSWPKLKVCIPATLFFILCLISKYHVQK